ncbi:MAG: thioredoxin fold domain-containing protein [Candidatus Obscuribacterales bacterium]|nr:thioredoxin fold domain-containing protein [Candidatus Obscuribacterales bacterium]
MKLEKQRKLRQSIGILVLTAALGVPLSSLAAPAGTSVAASPMTLGKSALNQKNYAKAVQIYSAAAKTEQYKNNCECRLGLGKSLCKLGASQKGPEQQATYKQAVKELRTAVRLGKGNTHTIEANAIMLTLPKTLTAPKSGADTPMIAMANGIPGRERGGVAMPKVLEFYASWCEPCKQLKQITNKAKSDYAGKVEFISYDIDKPESEKVIEDYEVSPIPTLIFLDGSNQVITYSIGYSGENGLKAGMKKILPPS